MSTFLSGVFATMMLGGGISAGCSVFFGLCGGDKRMCAAGFIVGAGAAILGVSLLPLVTP